MITAAFAEYLADALAQVARKRMAISDVFPADGSTEFYVDLLQPGEGSQRFTVTVTDSTDIQT